MAFLRRKIDVVLQFGQGAFGDDGFDQVDLSGLRVSANISKAGDPGFSTATIRLWGLTSSLMNRATTLGKPLQYFRNNVISLLAGDDETGMSLVFNGTIQTAYQDFNGAPDASLNITAFIGLIDQNRPVPPFSAKGGADAVTILSGLATQMGLNFENNGVTGQLSNPYFPGTARSQVEACCRAINCYWIIDNNALAVWPKGGKRGGLVPRINKASGLVGYPQYTSAGIGLRTLFNPGINYGAEIQLESEIKPADGTWIVNKLAYALEAEMPDGAWFTDLEAYRIENAGA